jgi:hypothetical protein
LFLFILIRKDDGFKLTIFRVIANVRVQ